MGLNSEFLIETRYSGVSRLIFEPRLILKWREFLQGEGESCAFFLPLSTIVIPPILFQVGLNLGVGVWVRILESGVQIFFTNITLLQGSEINSSLPSEIVYNFAFLKTRVRIKIKQNTFPVFTGLRVIAHQCYTRCLKSLDTNFQVFQENVIIYFRIVI